MKKKIDERLEIIPWFFRWLFLSALIAGLAGSASAIFLKLLDAATNWRESHVWILAFLPLAGFAIGWIYDGFGRKAAAGNNLLIDEIHDPKNKVPLRMAPLILFSTVVTHLFGGSAGREGTAIQMGGSLADQLTRPFQLEPSDRRILLIAGISAGFASVFGTPLAGAVFGLEVLAVGRIRYDAVLPCFLSAILADRVAVGFWGIHHAVYALPAVPHLTFSGLLSILFAGMLFGLTGMIFSAGVHGLGNLSKKYIPYAPLRPVVGGMLVAGAVWAMKSTQYIGLGIPTITRSFSGFLAPWDFILKMIFTIVTLGFGFKGGEVTPLFFIGAALGNTLGLFLPLSFEVLAAVGFVAVFAGAANTPLACTVMAIEIFGHKIGVYAGLGCVMSYLFSGYTGIYRAQRTPHPKHLDSKQS